MLIRCPVCASSCRVPDTCPVKKKMVYAGSKDALTRVLVGVSVKLNATDRAELDFDTVILPACKKFT